MVVFLFTFFSSSLPSAACCRICFGIHSCKYIILHLPLLHLLTHIHTRIWCCYNTPFCFVFFRITYFLVQVFLHRHIVLWKPVATITVNHSILQGALTYVLHIAFLVILLFNFAFFFIRWLAGVIVQVLAFPVIVELLMPYLLSNPNSKLS